MTIELGFAALQLPNGEQIGIVDTPGHRDFIGNMLAGIGGVDAVLLVMLCRRGRSAQTREHLAILDLTPNQKALSLSPKPTSSMIQNGWSWWNWKHMSWCMIQA